MTSWLQIVLALYLTVSLMGCGAIKALNTYPPGYEPSDFEKSIGPPYWYLIEKNN